MSLQGVLQLLGDIGNSFYTPKLNAYGMKDGVPVDANGNPTSLFENPGGFQRAFNPMAQQIQQENAQYSAAPLLAQQALFAKEQEAKGMPVATAQGDINAANLIGQQPEGTVGIMAGRGTMNPDALSAFNLLKSRVNSGFYPATVGAETAQALTTQAQNPEGALPNISRNVMREQGVDIPYRMMSDELGSLNPGLGSSALNIGHIDPITGAFSSMRNPVQSLQGVLLGNSGLLGGGVTGPSGATYQRPQPTISVPPLSYDGNPQSYTPPPSVPAVGTRPVQGVPGYEVDDDGNVFYHGQHVPEEQLKGTHLEKVINSQKTFEKNLKDYHSSNALPVHSRVGDFAHAVRETYVPYHRGMPILGEGIRSKYPGAEQFLQHPLDYLFGH